MMTAQMRYYSRIRAGRVLVTPPGCGRLVGVDVNDGTCSVNGCDKPARARTWCSMHYRRWQVKGSVGQGAPMSRPRTGTCSVEGCDNPDKARGWCDLHYLRFRRLGAPGAAAPLKLYGMRSEHGRKLCTTCREWVAISAFGPDKRSSDGLKGYCRPCRVAADRNRKYGLSPTEYAAMVIAQGGACAMCGDVPISPLVTDHCHASGAVRELLCNSCNVAIGFLGDASNRALAAAAYLQKWDHLKGVDRGVA